MGIYTPPCPVAGSAGPLTTPEGVATALVALACVRQPLARLDRRGVSAKWWIEAVLHFWNAAELSRLGRNFFLPVAFRRRVLIGLNAEGATAFGFGTQHPLDG
jgi:hypothetical protein